MGTGEAKMDKLTQLTSGMWVVSMTMMMMMMSVMTLILPLGCDAAPTNGNSLTSFTLSTNSDLSFQSATTSKISEQGGVLQSTISSLSNPDTLGSDDGSYVSLSHTDFNGPQEVVGESEIDDKDFRSGCLANQFWNTTEHKCMNCTVCHPGTEHKHHFDFCGHGFGGRDVCQLCVDGFFQDETSHTGLKCRRCRMCDPKTEVLKECSATHNRKCGPCPKWYFNHSPNICEPCESETDSTDCSGFGKVTPKSDPVAHKTTPVTEQSSSSSSSSASASAAPGTKQTTQLSNHTSQPLTGNPISFIGDQHQSPSPTCLGCRGAYKYRSLCVSGLWIALPIISVIVGLLIAVICCFKKHGILFGTGESQNPPVKKQSPPISNVVFTGENVSTDDEAMSITSGDDHPQAPSTLPDDTPIGIGLTGAAYKPQTEEGRLLGAGHGNRPPSFDSSNLAVNVLASSSSTVSKPGTLRSWDQGLYECQNDEETGPLLGSDLAKSHHQDLAPLVMPPAKNSRPEANSPDSITNSIFEDDNGECSPISEPGELDPNDYFEP